MIKELIPSGSYIDIVSQYIDKAEHRIACTSLIFLNDPTTKPLIKSLADASRRGVNVTVNADFSTFSYSAGGGRPASYFSKHVIPAKSSQQILTSSGAEFDWMGQNVWFMFAGRTHSKWIIVDDDVFSFGGMNISHKATNNADYMFHFHDHNLANKLIGEQTRIRSANKMGAIYKSHQFQSDYGTVLVDGGMIGDSLIYRRACQLASEASSICFVSQYCPSGKLGRTIKNKPHKVYFNHPHNLDFLTKSLIVYAQKTSGLDNLYSRDAYIHAKYMIGEMPDGSSRAITGSHNFTPAGVWAGTREIALETTDPEIIARLKDFTTSYIV